MILPSYSIQQHVSELRYLKYYFSTLIQIFTWLWKAISFYLHWNSPLKRIRVCRVWKLALFIYFSSKAKTQVRLVFVEFTSKIYFLQFFDQQKIGHLNFKPSFSFSPESRRRASNRCRRRSASPRSTPCPDSGIHKNSWCSNKVILIKLLGFFVVPACFCQSTRWVWLIL